MKCETVRNARAGYRQNACEHTAEYKVTGIPLRLPMHVCRYCVRPWNKLAKSGIGDYKVWPLLDVPAIEKQAEQFNAAKQAYIDATVRPHLQTLLDTAARRMKRHTIDFSQGMGCYSLTVNGDVDSKLSDAVEDNGSRRYGRLAERFPELVEFIRIVDACLEHLDMDVGDMEPS